MGGDFVRLAVFDDRGTALEALRMLQTNGVVEAHVWPPRPDGGTRISALTWLPSRRAAFRKPEGCC
jgi:hypothetical protein